MQEFRNVGDTEVIRKLIMLMDTRDNISIKLSKDCDGDINWIMMVEDSK